MKYLIKYNEHILSNNGDSSHLFSKILLLTASDLELDGVYKYKKKIESGRGRGNTISAIVRLIKSDNNKYHFKVIKILTPNIANMLNFKLGDIIIDDIKDIPKYYSIK